MHLVLPAGATLILKRLRPRKAAVLVQVIQMTRAAERASTCKHAELLPIHHCHLFNMSGINIQCERWRCGSFGLLS